MRRAAAVALLLLATAPACAAECNDRAAALVLAAGAKIERQSTVKIFLSIEGLSEVAVDCWPRIGFEAGIRDNAPPESFYRLFGALGFAVIGKPAAAIATGAQRCLAAARHDSEQQADVDFAAMQFECTSSRRREGMIWFGVTAD